MSNQELIRRFDDLVDGFGQHHKISVEKLKNHIKEEFDFVKKRRIGLKLLYWIPRNIFSLTKRQGVIFNKGAYVGKKTFSPKDRTFYYKGYAFTIIPDHPCFFTRSNLLNKTRYYFYDISDPFPMTVSLDSKTNFDPKLLSVILKSDGFAKLHQLSKPDWMQFFTLKNMMIVAIIIVAIYYFASGGTLT